MNTRHIRVVVSLLGLIAAVVLSVARTEAQSIYPCMDCATKTPCFLCGTLAKCCNYNPTTDPSTRCATYGSQGWLIDTRGYNTCFTHANRCLPLEFSPLCEDCYGTKCGADDPPPDTCSEPDNPCGDGDIDPSSVCAQCITPIVVSLEKSVPRFSDAAHGVMFDFGGRGQVMWTGWPEDPKQTGWLVLDRNGNGVIDNGTEMFGNTVRLRNGDFPRSGYQLLAELDNNQDGWIDAQDPIFPALRIWRDFNRDGISTPNETSTLAEVGILGLSVDDKPSQHRDSAGNLFRFRAAVISTKSADNAHFSWDVFPVRAPVAGVTPSVVATCAARPNVGSVPQR